MKYELLVIVFLILNCKQTEIKTNTLSGTIINNSEKYFIINYRNQKKDSVLISKSGKFTKTLRSNSNNYLLQYKSNFIRVFQPKYSNTSIVFDSKSPFKTLAFSGEYAHVNTFYNKKKLLEQDINHRYFEDLKKNEFEFIALKKGDKQKIDSLILAYNLPEYLNEKEKKENYYNYRFQLHNYPKQQKNLNYTISKAYKQELQVTNFNNGKDYNLSPTYRSLVAAILYDSIKHIALKKNEDYGTAFLKVTKNIISDSIKHHFIEDNAVRYLELTKSKREFIDKIIKTNISKTIKQQLKNTLKAPKTLKKGTLSPAFIDYENYNGGTTSLNDFKGQYVFIDIWATWCKPCIAEIPFIKILERQLQNKNIVFISISIDKNKQHQAWRTMVKNKQLTGVQLLADKNWTSDFIINHHIDAIPRFILLNPDGKIIDANAPKPSNPKLLEIIKKNLHTNTL